MKIKKPYVPYISKKIKQNPQAIELFLKGNRFGEDGLTLLTQTLIGSKIQTIDLSDNQLSEKALGIIRNIAIKNKEIKKIIFQDNKIKDERKEVLIEMFFKLNIELVLQ